MTAHQRAWTQAEIDEAMQRPTLSLKFIAKSFNCGRDAALRLAAICAGLGHTGLTAAADPDKGAPERHKPRQATEAEIRAAYRDGGTRAVRVLLRAGAARSAKIIAELGLTRADRMRKPTPPRFVITPPGMASAPDGSIMARAKDLMRRGYAPVCRARIVDPKAPPDQWIVGRRRMGEREMVALAAQVTQRTTQPPP